MSTLLDVVTPVAAPANAKLGHAKGEPFAGEVDLNNYAFKDEKTLTETVTVPKVTNRSYTSYKWGMLANDSIGDCGPAMCLHADEQEQLSVGNNPTPYVDADAVSIYEATAGYNPSTGANDNGTTWSQLATYMTKTGIKGNKILGTASVNTGSPGLVNRAIYEFDCLYGGVQLPLTAQSQKIWDYVPNAGSDNEPGSWGGHWVPVFSYDGTHYAFCSWGQIMLCTLAFFKTYFAQVNGGEGHVVVSPRQLNSRSGQTVAGFNLQQLQQDLKVA